MATMQDDEVRELLNLHWRRHKHTSLYRLRAEVSDYLRRVAGLAPDCRNMEDVIGEVTEAIVHRALVAAQASSTDITKLARSLWTIIGGRRPGVVSPWSTTASAG